MISKTSLLLLFALIVTASCFRLRLTQDDPSQEDVEVVLTEDADKLMPLSSDSLENVKTINEYIRIPIEWSFMIPLPYIFETRNLNFIEYNIVDLFKK